MRSRLDHLLYACAWAMVVVIPLGGAVLAQDTAIVAKKTTPSKRLSSPQPSIVPVTEAAKGLSRTLQGELGKTITKQRLQEQSPRKKKKTPLAQGARFAVNDPSVEIDSVAGGRVLTPAGDLYVSYFPTADGVVGVIEESTRQPSKSKADQKRRNELKVLGFRLNKVVVENRFVFWPKGRLKKLAAVVSQPPEFISNTISPAQAAILLSPPKMTAKGTRTEPNFEGIPLPLAFSLTTGANPSDLRGPGDGSQTSGPSCKSSPGEIANCTGVLVCPSGGGECCCQAQPPEEAPTTTIPNNAEPPPSTERAADVQPTGTPIHKTPRSPNSDDEVRVPESPFSPSPQRPVVTPGDNEAQPLMPNISGSQGPQANAGHTNESEQRNLDPSSPHVGAPAGGDVVHILPVMDDSPGPQPGLWVTVGLESSAPQIGNDTSPGTAAAVATAGTDGSPTARDAEVTELVAAFVDNYQRTTGECPSPGQVIAARDIAANLGAQELNECLSTPDTDDDSQNSAPEDESDPAPEAPAPQQNDAMACSTSPRVQKVLAQAVKQLPRTAEALQKAACESKGKTLEDLIDVQRTFIRGTQTRLADVRRRIAEIEGGYLTFFVSGWYGTLDSLKKQESIEIGQLAAQRNRLSELEKAPKPACGAGDLKPTIQTDAISYEEQKLREELASEIEVLRKREGWLRTGQTVTVGAGALATIAMTGPGTGLIVILKPSLGATGASLVSGTLGGTAVGAAGNLAEAGGHLTQDTKDISAASRDALIQTAGDVYTAASFSAGGKMFGAVTKAFPASTRVQVIATRFTAGSVGATTAAAPQVAFDYATSDLTPLEALRTLGMSYISGGVGGVIALNNPFADIAANALLGGLISALSGQTSEDEIVKEAIINALYATVGKCSPSRAPAQSNSSASPGKNLAQNPSRLSAGVKEQMSPGVTKRAESLSEKAQESLNRWRREKIRDSKANPNATGRRLGSENLPIEGSGEQWLDVTYHVADDGSLVTTVTPREAFDHLLINYSENRKTGEITILDVTYLPKPPVPTEEPDWTMSTFLRMPGEVNKNPPAIGVNEPSPLLSTQKPPLHPEALAKKEAYLRDIISHQIDKLPLEVRQPITDEVKKIAEKTNWVEMPVERIDSWNETSFKVKGTDGNEYTVNGWTDPLTGKLIFISDVFSGTQLPARVGPTILHEASLSPLDHKTGEPLSVEARKNRQQWLDELPVMMRECPLPAQEPMRRWLVEQANKTDWNRNGTSDSLSAGQKGVVIEGPDGALYKFEATIDDYSGIPGDPESGRVLALGPVKQVRDPIKPKPVAPETTTQQTQPVTLDNQTLDLVTRITFKTKNYTDAMNGWAAQPHNCPPNAQEGFKKWFLNDLRGVDFTRKPIQFPAEPEQAVFDGSDGKYQFTFRRESQTGQVEPISVKFLRELLPSEQAAREWPKLRQNVMDALYPGADGIPQNPQHIEDQLTVLKDRGLLTAEQVTELIEKSKNPPSSDEEFYRFLDQFEDALYAARRKNLSSSGDTAPE